MAQAMLAGIIASYGAEMLGARPRLMAVRHQRIGSCEAWGNTAQP
jgi:hypothetical protein